MEFDADRFGGIERLYGIEAVKRFQRAHVMVVGIGGVGSWAVESLARSGVGALTLVDLDEICVTNVNRQIHAMDGQVGRLKTESMAARVRAIHPGCAVTVVSRFFNEGTAAEIMGAGQDAVIDAIDDTRNKCLLLAESRRRGMITVTSGGAGGRRNPGRIRVADLAYAGKDALLCNVRRGLRKNFGFPAIPQRGQPEPMGVDAVFSDEEPVFYQCDGNVTSERPQRESQRLNCTTGMGTVTHVTAVFGMTAAARVLEVLAVG